MSTRESALKSEALLDITPVFETTITPVFETRRKAMECMAAKQHLWDYDTDPARRPGTQLKRDAGPNLGSPQCSPGEASMRVFPQVTERLS